MDFLNHFAQVFFSYVRELWWTILIGFILSGIFYELVPTKIVERYLGQTGIRPILLSSLTGTLLPICCFGVLPIAVTLKRKGASLGPILAFLVTTPATSVSALMVCWKLMGIFFTFYIFFSVVLMGLIMGFAGNFLHINNSGTSSSVESCCHEESPFNSKTKSTKHWSAKIQGVFRFALVTIPKQIGAELLLGIAVASFIVVWQPLQNFIQQHLIGPLGYFVILIVGLLTYVCSTANVPMADALLKSGMSYGQAMTYLLVGPITSYGTILVLKKEFGSKVLVFYLFMICFLSTAFGLLFEVLMNR